MWKRFMPGSKGSARTVMVTGLRVLTSRRGLRCCLCSTVTTSISSSSSSLSSSSSEGENKKVRNWINMCPKRRKTQSLRLKMPAEVSSLTDTLALASRLLRPIKCFCEKDIHRASRNLHDLPHSHTLTKALNHHCISSAP